MRGKKRVFKATRRRRHQRIISCIIVIISLVIILGGIRFITYLDFWRINTFTIDGLELMSESPIKEKIEDKLLGSYWWLIPRNNRLFYPKDGIRDELKATFPRIKDVTVSGRGLTNLKVHIEERKPYALWCSEPRKVEGSESTSTPTPCFFLSREGFVFSKAPHFSDDVYLQLIDTSTSTQNRMNIGTTYRKLDFKPIAEFVDRLTQLEFEPQAITALQQHTVKIILSDGRYLLINEESDLDRVFDNLRILLDHQKVDISVQDVDSFSYVDLRFGERVFYNVLEDKKKK